MKIEHIVTARKTVFVVGTDGVEKISWRTGDPYAMSSESCDVYFGDGRKVNVADVVEIWYTS